MVVVQQLVEWEDPLTAAARAAGDTMTPLRAVYDELRVIVDRRLCELDRPADDRRRGPSRSGWCRYRAAVTRDQTTLTASGKCRSRTIASATRRLRSGRSVLGYGCPPWTNR
jgi:hypothetical protein